MMVRTLTYTPQYFPIQPSTLSLCPSALCPSTPLPLYLLPLYPSAPLPSTPLPLYPASVITNLLLFCIPACTPSTPSTPLPSHTSSTLPYPLYLLSPLYPSTLPYLFYPSISPLPPSTLPCPLYPFYHPFVPRMSVPLVPGTTALHAAVLQGSQRTIQTLLDAGANSSLTDSYGRIPLHLASHCSGSEVWRDYYYYFYYYY